MKLEAAHGRGRGPCGVAAARPVLGKSFALFSHGLKHTRVLGHVSVETPVFKISISSAEPRMTHLHRTKWKNTEYRKKDLLIRYGSDSVGYAASSKTLSPTTITFNFRCMSELRA
ncbi:hypothetical protein GOBAR_AA04886 [Gossypium barbadense]|uniref:Uncharacterized protein n=1 Tax=Gossypium barbadense TaxID=3634 RepID=A0A2P5YJB6_GOSBA|nr:hypothetical protein GOBAR_AA04886 [Gossypium barbadense]